MRMQPAGFPAASVSGKQVAGAALEGSEDKMRVRRTVLAVVLILTFIIAPCAFAYASDDAATVYVTISNDGEFVKGKDGTVMAHVPFEISYFDLAEYGLADYYRYEAAPFDEGGEYISSRIIKEPTLLHLYIKFLEKYYAGRKLTPEDMHSEIINVTQSPTHLFLQEFWGHNYNLMYFVDHAFPLQAKGLGATCDYILLYDGAEIDVAMFTDMGFYTTGAFVRFDNSEVTTTAGEDVTLTMLGTETKDGGGEIDAPVKEEPVRVSDDFGRTWDDSYGSTDKNGKITLNFSAAGTYYVSAGPVMDNYKSLTGMPDTAPPISVVTVKPEENAVPAPLVEIAGGSLSAPDIEKELDNTAVASGTGVKNNADVTWYDGEEKYDGKPLPGHTYKADIRLRPEAGYKLEESTVVKIGDEVLPVSKVNEDGTIIVSKAYEKIPDEGGGDQDEQDDQAAKERAEAVSRASEILSGEQVSEIEKNESIYTIESYQTFSDAVSSLTALVADEQSTASEIDAAITALRQAIAELKVKEEPDTPDKPDEPEVKKLPNTLSVKLAKKSWTIKAKTLKKKVKFFRAVTVKKAAGKVTYSISGTKKAKKALKFNKKTGKITVRKKTGKGLYKLTIKVNASGNSKYLPGSKTVTVKVRVK